MVDPPLEAPEADRASVGSGGRDWAGEWVYEGGGRAECVELADLVGDGGRAVEVEAGDPAGWGCCEDVEGETLDEGSLKWNGMSKRVCTMTQRASRVLCFLRLLFFFRALAY